MPDISTFRLSDLDFVVPPEQIAQRPADTRSASRLLVPQAPIGYWDRQFKDLPQLLQKGDLLIFNQTRVMKARLLGFRHPSGGKAEILVEEGLSLDTAWCRIKTSHAPNRGAKISLSSPVSVAAPDMLPVPVLATIEERQGERYRVRFPQAIDTIMEQYGKIPLPPYITHAPDTEDEERYQTIHATHPGAIAAPTAGLHFDPPLIQTLREQGIQQAFITLHVGADTFAPLRSEDLSLHTMHSEWYDIPPATVTAIEHTRQQGGQIIAVGTTVMRALESCALIHPEPLAPLTPGAHRTSLFITPGFQFRVINRLITNFHHPRATPLVLVCAFAGAQCIRNAYQHAIKNGYRFFSYGDAMILERVR